MIGKQRLTIGIPYGRLAIDLSAGKDLAWAIIPPLILALTLLMLVLLQNQTSGPVPMDGPGAIVPAAAQPVAVDNANWRQTDESYLSVPTVLR